MCCGPQLCPKCHGERQVADERSAESTATSMRSCPACMGAGIIWPPTAYWHQQPWQIQWPIVSNTGPDMGEVTVWNGVNVQAFRGTVAGLHDQMTAVESDPEY